MALSLCFPIPRGSSGRHPKLAIDRGLGPGQWADLGGYINTLALLARSYGLDTCPQVAWIRLYKIVGAFLQLPPEQMLFCGILC